MSVYAEETAANNENISSTGAQKLTFEDITALRNEGKSGRVSSLSRGCLRRRPRWLNRRLATVQEIIQKQVEKHGAFELKTEYSKDKYMKRKEAKCARTPRLARAQGD